MTLVTALDFRVRRSAAWAVMLTVTLLQTGCDDSGGPDDLAAACVDLGASGPGCYAFSALLVQFDTRGRDPLPSTQLVANWLPVELYDASSTLIGVQFDAIEYHAIPEQDYARLAETYPHVAPPDLRRIWYYYDAESTGDLEASYDELGARSRFVGDLRAALGSRWDQFDLVVVLSDALPTLGLKLDEVVSITDVHSVGGWGRGPDYTSAPRSDAGILDTAIHEIGHNFGLVHECRHCPSPISQECCNSCEGRNDIMSICRDRGEVVHTFGPCTWNTLSASVQARAQGRDGVGGGDGCGVEGGCDEPLPPQTCDTGTFAESGLRTPRVAGPIP